MNDVHLKLDQHKATLSILIFIHVLGYLGLGSVGDYKGILSPTLEHTTKQVHLCSVSSGGLVLTIRSTLYRYCQALSGLICLLACLQYSTYL